MGFRIRKSISLGKGLRLNLGKSGVTSATIGRRGAPHVTVGKGGTRFGTPIIPGTGISYETRLDKPSKKARRKNTTMNRQQGPAPMPAGRVTPMPQQAAMPTQQMPIIPPAGAMPSYAPVTPPYGGGNGGNPYKVKKPWYKRWWGITIIVLLIISAIDYILTPSKAIPNVVGQTVSEARTTLEKGGFEDITVKRKTKGFEDITVTPETKGQDKKWKVEEQTPEAGQKEKTSTSITLTVKRDPSDLPKIAKKGMMLDEAIDALKDEGYSTSDYKIESDSGESVNFYSNWEVLSAKNGVIRVHNKAADEEAARKAEEEKKKAEEEAARKAEEEKKAAEEQARQQAEQQAQQQAQQQAAPQQAQQQAAPSQAAPQQAQQQAAPPSSGTVRGGSFCDSEGSTGKSSAGNILTCRVASDGRLRWMK